MKYIISLEDISEIEKHILIEFVKKYSSDNTEEHLLSLQKSFNTPGIQISYDPDNRHCGNDNDVTHISVHELYEKFLQQK